MTTTVSTDPGRRLRAAMFVDFDNVYIGLRRLDPDAAEAFATDPAHWLSELEVGTDAEGDFSRRFLVRACYLNPSVFSRYRPNFTRAGFQVVDCPSLTQQGKSSADINLVLDAVDALAAETKYEEFVIVSADADFTPLALRCRAADRRVTIITASPAASAYRAVADTVITADDLAELVTSTTLAAEDVAPEPTAFAPVAPVAPVAPAAAAPQASAPATGTSGAASTPSGSGRSGNRSASAPAGPPATSSASTATAAEPAPVAAAPVAAAPSADQRAQLAARRAVLQRVRSADRPVASGPVAQAAQKADPTLPSTRWAGTGGLFAWLAVTVPELGASSKPSPVYVWDPKRFGEADLPGAVADTDPTALQRQVVAVTDTPGLSPANYRVLLTTLAEDVRATAFERTATSRRVRDACQEAGAAVGRSTVNFVISGVLYTGLELDASVTAEQVAAAWADNVVGLCRGARMELTDGDVTAIRAWVGGGLLDA
ncbi:MAG TPA: NYN domain-containing protein [Cellulomonas sp.]